MSGNCLSFCLTPLVKTHRVSAQDRLGHTRSSNLSRTRHRQPPASYSRVTIPEDEHQAPSLRDLARCVRMDPSVGRRHSFEILLGLAPPRPCGPRHHGEPLQRPDGLVGVLLVHDPRHEVSAAGGTEPTHLLLGERPKDGAEVSVTQPKPRRAAGKRPDIEVRRALRQRLVCSANLPTKLLGQPPNVLLSARRQLDVTPSRNAGGREPSSSPGHGPPVGHLASTPRVRRRTRRPRECDGRARRDRPLALR